MTYLDIAARGKNNLWRYIVAWPLALVFWLIFVLLLLMPVTLMHLIRPEQLQAESAGDHPILFFALQGVVFAGLIAGFTIAALLMHRKRFTDLCGNWSWRQVGIGAAVWLAILIVGTLIDWGLAPKGFKITAGALTPALVLTTVVCLAVQTFAEEFIFRGYLTQSLLLASKQPVIAAAISALVFGALHIPNGTPQAVNATVMGFVLALIAIRTGSLALGWGLHFINNLFGAVVVVSANDVFKGTPALFTQNTPDLLWVDTAFGLIALAVVALLVFKGDRLIAPAGQYPK
ncbi:hypothetical protein AEAC466_10325 [Asticcacaulis sp. AC466]|uniref:CPBP family intramembrane glutamic endopeptidase n=1 Tax=Asticcacaulis sp. AC466 TaxID=1282362 RepID=UPI0003C3E60A|nr:type II CAAX endopeptidase family protein [Asticcacaulis sp. AC466]ESQ84133.1 hypothetical protein AEAC466_10325 [Asticcacaulis sp. AC466]